MKVGSTRAPRAHGRGGHRGRGDRSGRGGAPGARGPRAAVATEVTLKGGLNDPKDPNIAVLEFLPESVKVATGTTVTWEIAGPEPHSVTFVPPGTAVPPSVDDRPVAVLARRRPTGPYDGTTLVNSGVLPARRGHDGAEVLDVVRQDRATYTYYCVLHPNMVGTRAGHRRHAGLAAEDHQGRQRARRRSTSPRARPPRRSCWRRSRSRRRTPTAPPPTASRWASRPRTPTCSRSRRRRGT